MGKPGGMTPTVQEVLTFSSGAFPSTPEAVPRIREFVREHVEPPPPDVETLDDLVLAVSEACNNAVLHSTSPEVRIRLTVYPAAVTVEVEDAGLFEPGSTEADDPWEGPTPRGRGITIMLALADEMWIRKGLPEAPGTLIRLVKRTATP